MTNEIIIKIKEEYSALTEVKDAHELDTGVTKLLKLLADLNMEDKYMEMANEALFAITATIEREIVECRNEYSKIRVDDTVKKQLHEKNVKKAIDQIRTDIIAVLNQD